MEERKLPQEGIDFNYLETADEQVMKRSKNPIVALHGEQYEGVIAQYGKISIAIDEVPPKLAFDFNIVNPGKRTVDSLINDAGFKTFLGDIIIATIADMAERQNENRNNNSEVISKE